MSTGRADRTFPLPIVDHHAHLRPGPSAISAARSFAEAGGTHLFLATQNYLPRPPQELEEYRAQFATTEEIARSVEREVGIRVFCVLAPYPIDLVHVAGTIGLRQAEELQVAALEQAALEVREGKAVALGEVGRAHFPVPPEVAESLERVFVHAIRLAAVTDCPAVMHTEDLGATGYREIAEKVARQGLPFERAVKHYSKGGVPPSERCGMTPSFLAKREVVKEALQDPGPWFLETDFLDDPERPGVALPLDTVPRRVRTAAQAAPEGDEEWWKPFLVPFVEAPRKVYGMELTRERPWTFPREGASPTKTGGRL